MQKQYAMESERHRYHLSPSPLRPIGKIYIIHARLVTRSPNQLIYNIFAPSKKKKYIYIIYLLLGPLWASFFFMFRFGDFLVRAFGPLSSLDFCSLLTRPSIGPHLLCYGPLMAESENKQG